MWQRESGDIDPAGTRASKASKRRAAGYASATASDRSSRFFIAPFPDRAHVSGVMQSCQRSTRGGAFVDWWARGRLCLCLRLTSSWALCSERARSEAWSSKNPPPPASEQLHPPAGDLGGMKVVWLALQRELGHVNPPAWETQAPPHVES